MSNEMTNLAAALLRDVPRFNVTVGDHTDPSALLLETDALAALSAHLDADLAERAGVLTKRLRKTEEAGHARHLSKADRLAAADLITALLAQNAALRAERDAAREQARMNSFAGEGYVYMERRAEAAEAEVEKLRGALEKIAGRPDYRLPKPQDIARAALTETATTEADNG